MKEKEKWVLEFADELRRQWELCRAQTGTWMTFDQWFAAQANATITFQGYGNKGTN